ncbi:MAG TPA: glycoside hydrolase family 20 zincin-like fold domain-containing protein [Candidatus Eisenbacteria bacterium]|nr:glycoside hydrolase family 20 zincin-like fold domain-containing protein [Candidatus Eisenbacteria bacterium]
MNIFPQIKNVTLSKEKPARFNKLKIEYAKLDNISNQELKEIAELCFWDYPEVLESSEQAEVLTVTCIAELPQVELDSDHEDLYFKQGYQLNINEKSIELAYESREGFVYGLTTLKKMIATSLSDQDIWNEYIDLEKNRSGYKKLTELNSKISNLAYELPACQIIDYPSVETRAVAPTFSWYSGYGRLGFDMQLWGYDEWVEYLHQCVDQKINQFNMVMYGYWPFLFEEYPETTYQDVPIEIWNEENERFIKMKYTHPNIEDDFLADFIKLAHKLGVKIVAYVGLNSYNGGYSIVNPEKRMIPPADGDFLNDFDSICLSDEENVNYIVRSMEKITELGFDGFALEESEEGFWFCTCDRCQERWHDISSTPGEAKHKANFWLLDKIYNAVREINPEVIVGIRAFRQPPLEKEPAFLEECVESIADDIVLFWAPGLYVPETEFKKWISAFGKERIWARDTESNSITSTMGRLYRIFESNVLRYPDEANVQVIERDIEQHKGSIAERVHGINGYMFEWFGYFMHQWAHGNFGWGSQMASDEFFIESCKAEFGEQLGVMILDVLQGILTIHESQMKLYSTPFPFQSNVVEEQDIPRIEQALAEHQGILDDLHTIIDAISYNPKLKHYALHFKKIENAHRRNRIIYNMMLASIEYDQASDPEAKEQLLDEILFYNELDFDIVKTMFFDINPVSATGVKSCMLPYHEIKRIIHNLRNPDDQDDSIICSGIEALGWLWLDNTR